MNISPSRSSAVMIPSLTLIGKVTLLLNEMSESGDYTKINKAISVLNEAGHLMIDHLVADHMGVRDCKTCPSCGRGTNENIR